MGQKRVGSRLFVEDLCKADGGPERGGSFVDALAATGAARTAAMWFLGLVLLLLLVVVEEVKDGEGCARLFDESDAEVEGGVGRNAWGRAASTVAKAWRDDDFADASWAHADDTAVEAEENCAVAEAELERPFGIGGEVEARIGGRDSASVADRDELAVGARLPLAKNFVAHPETLDGLPWHADRGVWRAQEGGR